MNVTAWSRADWLNEARRCYATAVAQENAGMFMDAERSYAQATAAAAIAAAIQARPPKAKPSGR